LLLYLAISIDRDSLRLTLILFTASFGRQF
jgi:hypothetical protein